MNLSTELEKEIEGMVEKAMQAWNVPGLAMTIVKDDQVLMARGFGIRELGKAERVDEHTLFAIGSNTKAFTAAALGLLVQEGKLAWDDPVSQYLPWFQLQDPHASQLITLRDLVCHRSGLGTWAGDVLLLSSYSAEEVVRRVRHIPPAFGFRAGYGYSNLMFVAAGLVISAVSGLSWDDFIRQRLFEPLGMGESVTNPRYFGTNANIAMPHEDVKGALQAIPYGEDINVGAAGSICASVADIAIWLRMQLNEGQLDGKTILSPAILQETHSPHTPIRLSALEKKIFPSRHFAAYGLGWFLSDIHGRLTIRHTGGVDGMLSSVALIPEEKLGIAIFSNKLPNSAFILLQHALIDRLLGIDERDWLQTYLDMQSEGKEAAELAEKQREAGRAPNTRPALDTAQYCGSYQSPILGQATVSMEGERMRIQLAAHKTLCGSLSHWHYDTFLCQWDNPVLGESLIPFISDGQGQVTELKLKIREDWIDPLEHVFTKTHLPA
jgi:CubicO group peptidase (beta-lactamase class C family)